MTKRGRGRGKGAHKAQPPSQLPAAPPARPTQGGASSRFAPSAAYLAQHSSQPVQQLVQPHYAHVGPPAPQTVLDGVLAGLQPVHPHPHPYDRSSTHSAPPAPALPYTTPTPEAVPAGAVASAPSAAVPSAAKKAVPSAPASDFIALLPNSEAPTPAAQPSTASDASSTSSSSSSSSSSSDSSDDESDDDAVASALVGERRTSAPASVPPEEHASSSSSSASSSDSSSDSGSDDDAADDAVEDAADDSDAISNLEEAVHENAGDEDDEQAQASALPFDLGSADEADDDGDDQPDDSLELAAHAARRKRRRLDSGAALNTATEDEDDDDLDGEAGAAYSTATSRAGSLDPVLSPPKRTSHPPPDHPLHATVSASAVDEADELEEGELPSEEAHPAPAAASSRFLTAEQARSSSAPSALYPAHGAAVDDPFALSASGSGLAGAVGRPHAPPASDVDDAGDRTLDMDMSFADLPADLVADPSRRPAGAVSIPAAAAAPKPLKASYERKVDLSGGTPAAPPKAASKVSYKPSTLAHPPVSLVDPSAPSTVPAKGVYIRRQPVATTPDPSAPAAATAAPAKAVYERPAGSKRAKAGKSSKTPGKLPLSKEEKLERLPPKLYHFFGDFGTLEAASDPTIFSVPHHTVLPGKNLPPPNEQCQHGFWPGAPSLKVGGKAIFPAPPTPLPGDEDDARPRVDVFIDNSNVLYSFLNWVRERPDSKVLNKPAPGEPTKGVSKDAKVKTTKVVTINGKKVRLDYHALFALLERGRKVERRVLVGSSTLWQTLEPAVEWGYEISLLQRVPRSEPSTSASSVAQAAQAAAAASKKRNKSGKQVGKKQQPVLVMQPQALQVKHFKEQAVDELVHLKILESLLDYTPEPLPLQSQVPPGDVPPPQALAAVEADPGVNATAEAVPNGAASAASVAGPAAAVASDGAPLAAPALGGSGAAEGVEVEMGELSEPAAPETEPHGEVAPALAAFLTDSLAAAPVDDGPLAVVDPAPEAAPAAVTAPAADSADLPSAPPDSETASAIGPADTPAPADSSARLRFLPSTAFLSGSVKPAQPLPPSAAPPKFATSTKASPAIKPKAAPPPFAPRHPPRTRPVLVIVTGDANSSEYNPGGFLGCVRRALDRGWDVEVVAFTHGISSLWTAEQMKRVTPDGRLRGELRVVDLAFFAEELIS
ncbi:hypothetical protein Rhopal_002927-T1 [Rhodotorula paludigena]|uniref:NYN domain-containing protein n=1 Tax=Rhodotorula paludigena TaxID=86838 RepID=A0AAV5GIF6_9BASI|nr:hypothetical protein Rhopal_002927-T1 [Rhodotorula paludigena]